MKTYITILFSFSISIAVSQISFQDVDNPCAKQILFTFKGKSSSTDIWQLIYANAIAFKAKFAIDADGSPRAYGPKDNGIDYLANAGHDGNWWAIVTDNDESNGKPILQKSNDPYPNMYISTTSMVDKRYKNDNPKRYVDSESIPYIALPKDIREKAGIGKGDLVWTFHTITKKSSCAIYADSGPSDGLGEGSVFLAQQLGMSGNMRKANGAVGGTSKPEIMYVVFPKTNNWNGMIPTIDEINKACNKLGKFSELANCQF